MRILLVALALLAASASLSAGDVEIIAHRGASHDAPENTLASINLAWKQDADAVEIDIYLSKDGHIVLMHDKDTERTGCRDELVVEQTLAELRQLDVGIWKSEKYKGERIPVLSQVLPTIPEGGKLYIEIKTESEILPRLKKEIDASGIDHEKLAIICFDYATITNANKMFPNIDCYWLSSFKKDKETGEYRPCLRQLIEKAKAADVDGLDLEAEPFIDADYVQSIKDAGLGIYVWTVDDPEIAKRLAGAGVDGITTDRPGFLKAELGLD